MSSGFGMPLAPSQFSGDPFNSVGFAEDFIGANINTDDTGTWDDVSGSGGSTALATDEANGAVELTSNSDDAGLELNGEPIRFDHTKDMAFACRLKVSALTGSGIFVGLTEEAFGMDTGAAITGNHIGFTTQDASIDFTCANGTSQSITDSGTDLVADTYIVLAFHWRAQARKVTFYIDKTRVGSFNLDDDNMPADATQFTIGLHNTFISASTVTTIDAVAWTGVR